MGYLCATLTQVFTRAGGADVSLRDVTIAQIEKRGWCWRRHAPETRGGFGGFWKSQLSSASGEDGWLSLARRSQASGLVAGATRVGGADGKVIIERLCISLPYVETFNSKVIKGFVPELRSRYVFFRVSGFLYSMYICYEIFYVHFTYPNLAMVHGEAPVMLELWGIRSTPLLQSLPDPLWPSMLIHERVLSKGKKIKLCTYVKLNCFKYNWL